jgi:hypothetical protein
MILLDFKLPDDVFPVGILPYDQQWRGRIIGRKINKKKGR